MTIWLPDTDLPTDRPRYLAIADAIQAAIRAGDLKPGDRLPTHRALADHLEVTVGTITRAYSEAMRRGIAQGEVGRGTFVTRPATLTRLPEHGPRTADVVASGFGRLDPAGSDRIELGVNFIPDCGAGEHLRRSLTDLAARPDTAGLAGYQTSAGRPEDRQAGADWIADRGWMVSPERVTVSSGGQNGIALALGTLCRPGDLVLTESMSYPGAKSIAELLGLRLQGVAIDEEGMRPDDLERICGEVRPKAVFCLPTLHNPTSAIMSDQRRRDVAEIARRNDLLLIEDDVYGIFPEGAPPPLAAYAPERTIYITGTSKAFCGGLRIGYVVTPERLTDRLTATLRAFSWMASPMSAAIASDWIRQGIARELLAVRRQEATARRSILLDHFARLPADSLLGHEASFFFWLRLPDPWRFETFTAMARQKGVAVTPADMFAIGRSQPEHGVRICLGTPVTRDEVEEGVRRLAALLDQPATGMPAIL